MSARPSRLAAAGSDGGVAIVVARATARQARALGVHDIGRPLVHVGARGAAKVRRLAAEAQLAARAQTTKRRIARQSLGRGLGCAGAAIDANVARQLFAVATHIKAAGERERVSAQTNDQTHWQVAQ